MCDSLRNILSFVSIQEAHWLAASMNPENYFECPEGEYIYCVLVSKGQVQISARDSGDALEVLSPGDILVTLDHSAPIVSVNGVKSASVKIGDRVAMGSEPLVFERNANDDVEVLIGRFQIDALYTKTLTQILPDRVVSRGQNGASPSWVGAIGDVDTLSRMLGGFGGGKAVSRRLAEISLIQVLLAHEDELLADSGRERMKPQIVRALRLMNDEPMEKWTVESLGRAVGMSRSSFSDAFGSSMGESPVRYLSRVRMKLAAKILCYEDISLMEVAHRVGYSSDIALNRAFKRMFGMTLSEYRNHEVSETVTPMKRPLRSLRNRVAEHTESAVVGF